MNIRSLAGCVVVFALGTGQVACAAPASDEEQAQPGESEETGGPVDDNNSGEPEVLGVTQQASTAPPSCVKITREWFYDIYNYWTIHSSCAGTYNVKIDVAYLPDTNCATIRPGQTSRSGSSTLEEWMLTAGVSFAAERASAHSAARRSDPIPTPVPHDRASARGEGAGADLVAIAAA